MHENYEDILSRIDEPPKWYDQNGTPRYGDFVPHSCPNIYSSQVGLFKIACQYCHQHFTIEMHSGLFDSRQYCPPSKWHYGDPPTHDCVGDTMNCDDLAVIEFWVKNTELIWRRAKEFEVRIDDDEE